jgi:hypothetical protein
LSTVAERVVVSRTLISHKRIPVSFLGNHFLPSKHRLIKKIDENETKQIRYSHDFTKVHPVKLNTNTFQYCLTEFTQVQLMKLVHLQCFKGGSVIEGIEMGRALGFLNNQNLILLQ